MADSNITKNALATALKQLMKEKPFEKISISDICDACGMNRKSFYYHFKDKYDLVNWIFYVDFIGKMDLSSYSNGWDLIEDICNRFYKDKEFYGEALKIKGQNSFHDYVLETIAPISNFFIEDLYNEEQFQDFFVQFFGDAFLQAIMRWLTEGMRLTPDEFVNNLKKISVCIATKIIEDEK